jgi:undecaprenyl-diphosphatase
VALVQLVVIALVQGITEFLPISSSAHLVLVPVVTGWPDQGILVDVAVHIGTLGAVIAYFRADVAAMLRGGLSFFGIRAFFGRRASPAERRLALALIIGTIPVVVAGLALELLDALEAMRSAAVIGWTSLIFGLVLYGADQHGALVRKMADMTLGRALLIGLAQVLALVPGTSRSGITMTAARALGFTRPEAARFSMVLSIPTIFAAGTLGIYEIVKRGDLRLEADALLAGGLAFVSALVAIALLMRWLQHASMTPFVVYRVVLGLGLLAWAYL